VQIWRRPYDGKSTSDISKSRYRSKVTSLIDRLKYTCDVTRDPSSNRQLYQCRPNDCNGRFTTLQSLRDNIWSRRLCRVVKRKSCETWIPLGRLMNDDACHLRSQSRQLVLDDSGEANVDSIRFALTVEMRGDWELVLHCHLILPPEIT